MTSFHLAHEHVSVGRKNQVLQLEHAAAFAAWSAPFHGLYGDYYQSLSDSCNSRFAALTEILGAPSVSVTGPRATVLALFKLCLHFL